MINEDYYKYGSFIIILILIGVSIFIIRPYFVSILASLLLVYITYPVYKLVKRKIPSENIASFIMCLLVIFAVLIPGLFLINSVIKEIPGVYSKIIPLINDSHFKLNEYSDIIFEKTGLRLELPGIIQTLFGSILTQLQRFLASLPNKLLNIFVVIFLMFFLYKDGPKITEKLIFYFPMHKKNKQIIFRHLEEVISAVIYGHVITAFAQSVVAFIGYLVFGVKSPIFFALITFLFALIPFIGPPFAYIPLSLLLFAEGLEADSFFIIARSIGLLLYGILIISTIDNIIKPKIISEKVKIHPAAILIGILGGIHVFGIFGIILGPLILSVLFTIFELYETTESLKDRIDHNK